MKLTSFHVDVTPPVGAPLAYITNERIDSPVYVRGIILEQNDLRVVLVACDFIYIWGDAWLEWRAALAEAAGIPPEQVLLHSVHQHDSLWIAPQMNEFLAPAGKLAVDEEYCRTTLGRVAHAVKKAVAGKWKRVTQVVAAENRVWGLASNRRIIGPDGKYQAPRFSMCQDEALRALPVGRIDPLLRTLGFAGKDDKLLAALHFYASHPMAAYMRDGVSSDVPGVALEHAARRTSKKIQQLYFTGCAGNVTFGKYFTGDKEESLKLLGKRLGKAMTENIKRLHPVPGGSLDLAKHEVEWPFPPDLADSSRQKELKPGCAMARRVVARDMEKWRNALLQRLSFGPQTHLVSFPSEVCVEYQLYAQSLVPEHFVACAAYANAIYHYIPTAHMYEEGGYEPNASLATPEVEHRLKDGIAALLNPL